MPRRATPSFVAEFPLATTAADEAVLGTRLAAARHLYNAVLGESLHRLGLMRQSRDWQRAREMPKYIGRDAKGKPVPNEERRSLFRSVLARFAFDAFALQKWAEACRDACWIGDHLGSHDTQTTSLRAFRAAEQHAYGVRGRPRFKTHNRMHSVEGKADAVLRFRDTPVPAVHWAALVLPLRLDRKDKKQWQLQALNAPNKYVRVIRRTIKGRECWFCQLVQAGQSPRLHDTRSGVVGCDVGPSTIAWVGETEAALERLSPSVEQPWAEQRRTQRAMDRSRRATNPGLFDHKGRWKKPKRRPGERTSAERAKLVRSARYRRLAAQACEQERYLAAGRKRDQGGLANRVLGHGTTIKSEGVSYRSFQKNYGRSVKVRAPGSQMDLLRRKAASAGGGLVSISTRTTRLSQFDHTTGDYVKKPLRLRTHVFRDRQTEPVQRDLYSAYLATCCDETTLDIRQARAAWPGAEPLLRRAMSRQDEPVSGKGHARSHARKHVRAGRPSKEEGRLVEAVDAVAGPKAWARATERPGTGTPGTPCL